MLTSLLERAENLDAEEQAERRRAWVSFAKVCLASAAMGACGWFGLGALPAATTLSQPLRIALGLGATAMCGIVYIVVAALLRTPEVELFTGIVKRRLKR